MTEETKQLLQQYYNLSFDLIPEPRPKSEWKPENKFGFFLGLIAHGKHAHIIQLHDLLTSNQFKDKEDDFIDNMFDYYIRPFHMSYSESPLCHTPSQSASRTSSDIDYALPGNELSHSDFKKEVEKRDEVCLFCWTEVSLEAAHIIGQKNIPNASLFLEQVQIHQKQNGMLLCKNCRYQFETLKQYVDLVENQMVLRLIKETNDSTSDRHRKWLRDYRSIRLTRESDFLDGRTAMELNGEMALYFSLTNPTILPNRVALEFHKTACFIWRMAGEAEIEDEYCSDDDDVEPVDTAALRRRFNWYDSE